MGASLNYGSYMKKLRGCFIGKAIGGTLGMPMEGLVATSDVTYYDPVPTGMIANDDLDLQVVWLEVLRRRGLPVNRFDLGEGWLEHMRALPDEYGVVIKNLSTGIFPPMSGYLDNKFFAGMGAAIRTEIWASLAPGDPALAVSLAREDACADHYDDGVEASGFLAAVESAAYLESDRDRLIETGLSFLNPEGRLSRMFRDTIRWWNECGDALEVRERILKTHYRQNWTDVGINLSFIILAWLAGGGDFSRSICVSAGLGHDADCTTATLGAILGIINPDGFEERWTKPLGDELILSSCIGNMHEVATISEFCEQIAALCADALVFYGSGVTLTGVPDLRQNHAPPWAAPGRFMALEAGYEKRESLIAIRPLMVSLTYPESLALAPGQTGSFKVRVKHPGNAAVDAVLRLRVPDGWKVFPSELPVRISAGGETALSFDITAPSGGRRIGKNNLDLNFCMNGSVVSVTAGLLQAIEWLGVQVPYQSDECPPDSLFAGAQSSISAQHFRRIPDGEQLFTAELRPSEHHARAILAAQGTRPMKVWMDGKLILTHDGGEYVPAFHRSDYVAILEDFTSEWHRIVIWAGEKAQRPNTPQNPGNALVPVPGSMPTAEQRKRYDSDHFYGHEEGELFFAIASRTATRWIADMEWRKPVV